MRSLAVGVVLLALSSVSPAKDELQVGDFVKQHLNSIGTEQARAAAKNRAAEGTLQFRVLNGAGSQDGKQVLVSEGNKLVSLLKLPNPSYHGERFVSDGKKTVVAELKPGVYSNLGQFVLAHNEILTEGLWGGTLSTGWALAHLDERLAKLQDRGLKKMDGRELHRVDYVPKKRGDLQIELYFEPDTFRHVMTSYELTINPQLAKTELENALQQPTHYRLEERFSDFKETDKLSLPGRWIVQFSSEVPEARASNPQGMPPITEGESQGHPRFARAIVAVSRFEVTVTNISHNVQLDPKNFEVR